MGRPRKNPDQPPRHPPQPHLVPIGQRLRKAREIIPGKPSQAVAGAAIGVESATWSQWERGIWPPRLEALLWVTERSGATVEWIITGSAAAVLPADVAEKLLPYAEYRVLYPTTAVQIRR